LCPECLNKREAHKANSYIIGGILTIILGVIFAAMLLPLGIFILIIGIGEIAYGINKRPAEIAEVYEPEGEAQAPEEMQVRAETEQMEEADLLYNQLLSKYAEHWGLQNGAQILDNEIRAYTWQGDTFEQAVAKVYKRQQNKR